MPPHNTGEGGGKPATTTQAREVQRHQPIGTTNTPGRLPNPTNPPHPQDPARSSPIEWKGAPCLGCRPSSPTCSPTLHAGHLEHPAQATSWPPPPALALAQEQPPHPIDPGMLIRPGGFTVGGFSGTSRLVLPIRPVGCLTQQTRRIPKIQPVLAP